MGVTVTSSTPALRSKAAVKRSYWPAATLLTTGSSGLSAVGRPSRVAATITKLALAAPQACTPMT